MARYIFQQAKLPPLNSDFGQRLAKNLWDLKLWFGDARREREQWVEDCDEAYLCHRYKPNQEGIDLIDDGEFGESDLHDATNIVSIRLALALMPRNEPWLTVSSREDEADSVVQGIQDLQMFLHRKAKTRRNVQKAIKQNIVRGSTYLWFDWLDRYRKRRLTTAENAKAIHELLMAAEMTPEQANQVARGRYNELVYSAPIVQVVDFYDVWLHPRTDIINDHQPSYIRQKFPTLSHLYNEVDENDKPIYSNLKDLEPWPIEELMNSSELAGGRVGSNRMFGSTAGIHHYSGCQLVPVYVIYLPYFKFEGKEFYDTYFTLAISYKGCKPRLIKIEENPNDLGISHLLIDHYVDFYTNTPYGISGIQYQVSKLRQKDFLQMLTVTAAAHSIFPPNLVLEEAFRDEDELSFAAGWSNYVQENPLGLEVVKPLQMPERGTILGQQALKFWADEMRAGTGVDGLTTDNGSRSLTKPKTATEINRDVSSGSFFLDNQAENMQDFLTNLCQGVYQLSTVNLKPSDERPGQLEYEKYLGDKVLTSYLEMEALREVKRSITVQGMTGQLNREQATQNLLKMFEITGQMATPRMEPIRMYLAQKLSKKLDANIPDELFAPTEQLLMENPEIQMGALQMAMQNPEMMQQILQALQPQIEVMMSQQGGPNDVDQAGPAEAEQGQNFPGITG